MTLLPTVPTPVFDVDGGSVTFSHFAKPEVLPRPRFWNLRGRNIVYNPAQQLKLQFQQYLRSVLPESTTGTMFGHTPVSVDLVFRFRRPASHFRASGDVRPKYVRKRPSSGDLDNMIKFILDCLSSVVYPDDALVVSIRAAKIWGSEESTTVLVCNETYW
jgi:Holliday junction resolvase RusA-like endonuclease